MVAKKEIKYRLWGSHFLNCCIIALAVFLSFGAILEFKFTDIDTWPLLLTSSVQSFADLTDAFRHELLNGRMVNARYYRPLLTLTYAFDQRLWGFNPLGFHLTNLLLHCFNSFLVYFLGYRLLGKSTRLTCLFAGILFAIHPLHVENVPAIARRAEILVTFFLLTAILAYLQHWRSRALLFLSLFFYGLGLLAKETMILLPFILFFASLYLDPILKTSSLKNRLQSGLPRIFKSLSPFLLLTGFYLLIRFAVLAGLGGYGQKPPFSQTLLMNVIGHPMGLLFAGFSSLWPRFIDSFLWLGLEGIFLLLSLSFMAILVFINLMVKNYRQTARPAQPNPLRKTLKEHQNSLMFLFWVFMGNFLLLGSFGFNFRYLYFCVAPFSIVLALAIGPLITIVQSLKFKEGFFRLAHLLFVALMMVTLGNLLLGSPLFHRSPLKRWQQDAQLAETLLSQVGEVIQKAPEKPTTLFLVNFPYQVINHPLAKIVTFPLSVITLEHAVQAYVDLHYPQKTIKIVGLSYLYLFSDFKENPVQIDTSFSGSKQIYIQVFQGGYPTPLPWAEFYGPHHFGRLYKVERPMKNRKDQLLVELTQEGLNLPHKTFLVSDGSDTFQIIQNPFQNPFNETVAKEDR